MVWLESHNVFFALMYMYWINWVVESQPIPFMGKWLPSICLKLRPKDNNRMVTKTKKSHYFLVDISSSIPESEEFEL